MYRFHVALRAALVAVCLVGMSMPAWGAVVLLSSDRLTESQIVRSATPPAPVVASRSDLLGTPAMGGSDGLNDGQFSATTFITAGSSFAPGRALFQPFSGALLSADAVQVKTTGTATTSGTPRSAHAQWTAHLQMGILDPTRWTLGGSFGLESDASSTAMVKLTITKLGDSTPTDTQVFSGNLPYVARSASGDLPVTGTYFFDLAVVSDTVMSGKTGSSQSTASVGPLVLSFANTPEPVGVGIVGVAGVVLFRRGRRAIG